MKPTHSKTQSVVAESETVRLQRELEAFTIRLEYEKRQSSFLDEQVLITQSEIQETAQHTEVINPVLQKQVAALQHKLDKEAVKLNEVRAVNQSQREKINLERKILSQSRSIVQELTERMCKYVRDTEKQHDLVEHYQLVDQRQRLEIHSLRSKSAHARRRHHSNVSQLHSYLNSELQAKHQACKERGRQFELNTAKQSNAVHVLSLLKGLKRKWTEKLQEAKTQTDSYVRWVRQLRDGFRQIEIATGVNQVDEVVTSFIKSEEQHYEVVAYLNSLNTEVEVLEDAYARIRESIQTHSQVRSQHAQREIQAWESTDSELQTMRNKLAAVQKHLDSLHRHFAQAQPHLAEVSALLATAGLASASVTLTHGEALETALGQLEQGVNAVQFLTGYFKQEARPMLRQVPMQLLQRAPAQAGPLEEFLNEKELCDDFSEFKSPVPLIDLKRKAQELYWRRARTPVGR